MRDDMRLGWIARSIIGSSTMRNQGVSRHEAAVYVKVIDLAKLKHITTQEQYDEWLNNLTEEMMAKLKTKNFGICRKVLNIFLIRVVENKYLSRDMQIDGFLEVPVDNLVAKRLKKYERFKWSTIKGLTPDTHSRIQSIALRVAKEKGVKRYELDLLIWGVEREWR